MGLALAQLSPPDQEELAHLAATPTGTLTHGGSCFKQLALRVKLVKCAAIVDTLWIIRTNIKAGSEPVNAVGENVKTYNSQVKKTKEDLVGSTLKEKFPRAVALTQC